MDLSVFAREIAGIMTTSGRGQRIRLSSRLAIAMMCVFGFGLATIPPSGAVPMRPLGGLAPRSGRGGKLSSRLSALAGLRGFGAAHSRVAALGLPASGAGSLVRTATGGVLVEIRTTSTSASTIASLRDLGARIVNVSTEYSRITASVAPSALAAISSAPGVIYVSEVLAPMTAAAGANTGSGAFKPAVSGCHPTISEGDSLMRVATARAAQSVNGAGQTIGVLSDSYNLNARAPTHAADDIASGDLPGPANKCGFKAPVKVQAEPAGGGADEGRAMLELAHGLAPGAHLAFATADNGDLDFAKQITKLRTVNHASVLVDDVSYFNEPFFLDGPIAKAANAASAAGVPYFSAAGNSNVIVGGKNVSSYEAPAFRATACPAAVLAFESVAGCHDFKPGGGTDNGDAITVAGGGGFAIDLQWAQPWGGVKTDYDLFVVNSAGAIVAYSDFAQASYQEPFEFLGYGNSATDAQTFRVVIAQVGSGPPARLKFAIVGAAGINAVQYDTSSGGDVVGPTIFGHNGAATVGSTAAIPYDSSSAPEDYSSRGPVTLYYQPTPSTTALPAPQVLNKPDFAATDNVSNVFFYQASGSVYRFAGTSAAAPQAAAIGALLRQQDPALSPAQIMTTLGATAQSVPTNGTPDDVGGGYLDANAALASVVPLPGVPRVTSSTNGNARATLHWTAALAAPRFPVVGYRVTPIRGGVVQPARVFNSNATSRVVAGLTNGASYTFSVAAINANGAGPESSPSDPIVIGEPGAPSGVTATAGHQSATIHWKAPSGNGKPITSYVVIPYIGSAAKGARVIDGAATTQTIRGLITGKRYTFRVAAKNARGIGATSAPSKPVKVT
jgi:hypothetical protein